MYILMKKPRQSNQYDYLTCLINEESEFDFKQGQRSFSFRSTPASYSMGILVVLPPEGKVVRHNVPTHLHLLPMLRKYGAVPPVPHMSSWHGAKLSTGR
jgi:hypothetical protein